MKKYLACRGRVNIYVDKNILRNFENLQEFYMRYAGYYAGCQYLM